MALTDLKRFIPEAIAIAPRRWDDGRNDDRNFAAIKAYLERKYPNKKWKTGMITNRAWGERPFWYLTEQDAGGKKLIYNSNEGKLEVV